MQKIVLALTLVACAGAERDADAMNSLASLLLNRNPVQAFNPSTPAARFAMRKPTVANSRPVAMKADSSEPDFQPMDLRPEIVQAAGLLAAMSPFMALADDDGGEGLKTALIAVIIGFPGLAVLWVLFNVGRNAFNQVGRQLGENDKVR
mmetsp:Transcript_20242/g.36560  ORF Transcript_20242/g.36560 Transcript_20242/m.36560 type:complete len:149 (+) Transcript_20242:98-544(+)